MEFFFVYILKCSNGKYYVGHTDNIDRRISEHKSGEFKGYVSKHLPVEVVFVETFGSRDEAFRAEQQIKNWSRKKKEALIKQNWKDLKKFSKKEFK